jgi:MFS family permease
MISTALFARIREPVPSQVPPSQAMASVRAGLAAARGFMGFVVGAFIFNMALQIAAPFFNVYLVKELGANTATVGFLAAVSSFTALIGYQVFSRLVDKKGPRWVMLLTGFIIPVLPLAWILVTAPWQVALINTLGGFIWAGYNQASFTVLLRLTPDRHRPRLTALYQTAVFSSAVIGPLLGGFLADAVSFQLIFAVSGIGRIVGMLVVLLFTARPLRRGKDEV